MKRLTLATSALLLLSSLVFAVGEKTFHWTLPTEREDNTPIAQNEIATVNIYCDGSSTAIWNIPSLPDDNDQFTAPADSFANGAHSCFATVTDLDGQESEASNTVNFTVSPARPKPPLLVVQ